METIHKANIKTPEHQALEREIELLRERLEDKNDVIQDLRKRLDNETEERTKLTRLIADNRSEAHKSPSGHKKGILARWLHEND